ncbi:hypothetical protein GCM10009801_72450 [Streptomyces albiaxialis]|uniref:Uncharacterized protein n=1 Tax=Streptomyces albiaxialis TaxID=329523 RepID=A0ABP5IKB5_9ACTN
MRSEAPPPEEPPPSGEPPLPPSPPPPAPFSSIRAERSPAALCSAHSCSNDIRTPRDDVPLSKILEAKLGLSVHEDNVVTSIHR